MVLYQCILKDLGKRTGAGSRVHSPKSKVQSFGPGLCACPRKEILLPKFGGAAVHDQEGTRRGDRAVTPSGMYTLHPATTSGVHTAHPVEPSGIQEKRTLQSILPQGRSSDCAFCAFSQRLKVAGKDGEITRSRTRNCPLSAVSPCALIDSGAP